MQCGASAQRAFRQALLIRAGAEAAGQIDDEQDDPGEDRCVDPEDVRAREERSPFAPLAPLLGVAALVDDRL
jgi:hypothetical protein